MSQSSILIFYGLLFVVYVVSSDATLYSMISSQQLLCGSLNSAYRDGKADELPYYSVGC